jgi:hypothetical protein
MLLICLMTAAGTWRWYHVGNHAEASSNTDTSSYKFHDIQAGLASLTQIN